MRLACGGDRRVAVQRTAARCVPWLCIAQKIKTSAEKQTITHNAHAARGAGSRCVTHEVYRGFSLTSQPSRCAHACLCTHDRKPRATRRPCASRARSNASSSCFVREISGKSAPFPTERIGASLSGGSGGNPKVGGAHSRGCRRMPVFRVRTYREMCTRIRIYIYGYA